MNKSFNEIVDSHYENLYRFAYSLSKSPEWASDLVQQTFYIWAKKGHQLKQQNKEKSWLFTTLHREFLRQSKRDARITYGEIHENHNTSNHTEETGRNIDASRALDLLLSLDEPHRTPLVLYYLNDKSYIEISEILDIPKGTVMSRISRGKSKLKNLMEVADQSTDKILHFKTEKEG